VLVEEAEQKRVEGSALHAAQTEGGIRTPSHEPDHLHGDWISEPTKDIQKAVGGKTASTV
jgi:hypothetical protein